MIITGVSHFVLLYYYYDSDSDSDSDDCVFWRQLILFEYNQVFHIAGCCCCFFVACSIAQQQPPTKKTKRGTRGKIGTGNRNPRAVNRQDRQRGKEGGERVRTAGSPNSTRTHAHSAGEARRKKLENENDLFPAVRRREILIWRWRCALRALLCCVQGLLVSDLLLLFLQKVFVVIHDHVQTGLLLCYGHTLPNPEDASSVRADWNLPIQFREIADLLKEFCW